MIDDLPHRVELVRVERLRKEVGDVVGMHGDAAQSNRIEAAFQALQLLESVSTDIIREEYVMDVLSRLSLLQHNIHLQLQRGNMRRNAPDFV